MRAAATRREYEAQLVKHIWLIRGLEDPPQRQDYKSYIRGEQRARQAMREAQEGIAPEHRALSVSEHLASVAHRILRFAFDRVLCATRLLIKSHVCVLVSPTYTDTHVHSISILHISK